MASNVACPACGKTNRIPLSGKGVVRCGVCKTPLPWIVDVDDRAFEQALEASVPVLVDFWAPWCGPCRLVGPTIDKLARAHAGKLKVVRVNVDEAPQSAARNRAMSIPMLLLLRNGAEVERMLGALPEAVIDARLRPYLEPSPRGRGTK